MVYQVDSQVLENIRLGEDCFKLILSAPEIVKNSKAGNFVHIQVNPFFYPLLRRAFSIHNVDQNKKTLEVVFKVVGMGTKQLSEKKPKDTLNLLGPLGNIFSYPDKDSVSIMVAGGLGIVPVYFLTSDLLRKKHGGKIFFLYGAKEKEQLYCIADLAKLENKELEILYSTDDGSYGFKGYLDQLLKEVLKKEAKDKVKIYACGPEPLLAKLSRLAKAENLFCQLSLEVGMPCGMGTCMGCVVKYKSAKGGSASGGKDCNSPVTFKRVCCEGPVFNACEVILE